MKKLFLTLIPSLLLAQGVFDHSGRAGVWEIGGEAIYWTPCTPSIDVATLNNQQQFFSVRPNWELGWRIFGSYYSENCCNFFTLDWIHLKTTDTKILKFTDIPVYQYFFESDDDITRVGGKIRTKYNRVNLRAGRYLHRGCDIGFYAYLGGRYIDIKKKEWATSIAAAVPQQFFQRAVFEGGGAELGVGADYCLFGRFSIVSNFGIVAALGEERLHAQRLVGSAKTNTRFRNRTHCVLGVDWRAGFRLSGRLSCFYVVGELGYEVNYYHAPFSMVFNYTLERQAQNVGFAGPYGSLSLRF